jgi:hypothetical protein
MSDCIYETDDGYCILYSDEEYREPCVEGPCDDECIQNSEEAETE